MALPHPTRDTQVPKCPDRPRYSPEDFLTSGVDVVLRVEWNHSTGCGGGRGWVEFMATDGQLDYSTAILIKIFPSKLRIKVPLAHSEIDVDMVHFITLPE
jgi:hypothetical protein